MKRNDREAKTRCPLGIFVCSAVFDWFHGVHAGPYVILVYRQLYGLQSNVKMNFIGFGNFKRMFTQDALLEITL